MKPTSPLSLLLFLQITTGTRAAPVPLHSDCLHYASCDPSLRDIFSESLGQNHHHTPPPTTLSNPHFPSHQLDNSIPRPSPEHPALPPPSAEEQRFNNAPVTPPSTIPPNTALAAEVPLESSYLLSLAQKPIPSAMLDTSAAKPTSALPSLRKADLKRYRDAMAKGMKKTAAPIQQDHKMIVHGKIANMPAPKCMHMGILNNEEGRGVWKASQPRDYSDLIVVGIVVLFLVAVAAMEAAEKLGDLRQAMFGSPNCQGHIRLDEEDTLFIVKKPFYLQPAPPPKWKIRSLQKGTLQKPANLYSEDEETDVESFKYDSDAKEEEI